MRSPRIFSLCIALAVSVFGQAAKAQVRIAVESLDHDVILTTMFGAEEIDSIRGAKWKPDVEERLHFVVSDDGYCYTTVDTILRFSPGRTNRSQSAVVLFVTNAWFGDEKASCHACAPEVGAALFEREEGVWSTTGFQKYLLNAGQWGEPGRAELFSLGVDRYGILVYSHFFAQGYATERAYLFDLSGFGPSDRFTELLWVETLNVGPAGCEEECEADWCDQYRNIERNISSRPALNPNPDHPGYHDVVVTETEKDCKGNAEQTSTLFSFDGRRYIPTCDNTERN